MLKTEAVSRVRESGSLFRRKVFAQRWAILAAA
jgi:hypothetical protein